MTFASKTFAVCSMLTLVAAAHASAQARPLGDTLRFKQTSKMVQDIPDSPMGAAQNLINSDGVMVVAFGKADTVRLWIESMKMSLVSMGNDMSPDVSQMLNKQWVGTLTDGQFKLISAPKLAAENIPVPGMDDPQEQFPLETHIPKGALTKGMTWTDTLDKKPTAGAAQQITAHSINKNTVVGDSTMYGVPVVIIETVSSSDTDVTMSVMEGQMTVKSKAKLATTSRHYYSPAYHVALLQTATASGSGHQDIEGQVTMSMNSTQKVESSTSLIR